MTDDTAKLSTAEQVATYIETAQSLLVDAVDAATSRLEQLEKDNADLGLALSTAEHMIEMHDDELAGRDIKIRKLEERVDEQHEAIRRLKAENGQLRKQTLWQFLMGGGG